MGPRLISRAIALCALATAVACGPRGAPAAPPPSPEEARTERIRATIDPLRAIHEPPGKPGPSDWLAMHDEPGQTFDQYLRAGPLIPDAQRKILYVQPLGDFTPGQRTLVEKTADFLGRAYALEVRIRPDRSLKSVPPLYRRAPAWGGEQILTKYVLEIMLKPDLPPDAMAMIAFTATDLWPGAGWNFVFGQATLQDRVGVWSLARLGDPDGTPDDFRLALLRTLKIATHETGHMFTIRHCTAYRCVMAGNNGLAELDRTPLRFCPDDFGKLLWATGEDAGARLARMEEFARREGLVEEAVFFAASRKRLADRG